MYMFWKFRAHYTRCAYYSSLLFRGYIILINLEGERCMLFESRLTLRLNKKIKGYNIYTLSQVETSNVLATFVNIVIKSKT